MRLGRGISPIAATVTVVLSMRSSAPKTAPNPKCGPRSNMRSGLSSECLALPRCAIAGSKRTRIACWWPVRSPICSSRAAIYCAARWRNRPRSTTAGCRRHRCHANNDTTAPTLSLIAATSMPDIHSQLLVQSFLSGGVDGVHHIDRQTALVENVGNADVLDLEGRSFKRARRDDDVTFFLKDPVHPVDGRL